MEFKFDPSMNVATFSPQSAVEKRNCVEKGYYEDNFIKHICPKTFQPPALSFFDYIRVVGNRTVISHFFNNFKSQKVQFVNLGCGMDSLSLWVMTNFTNSVCYDLDLEFQTRVKSEIIRESEELLSIFPKYSYTESSFHSDRYHLIPCDLRHVNELDKLKDYGFSSELPTIYLSEFALTYIENHLSNKVISECTTMTKAPSIFINHEQIFTKGPIFEAGLNALENNRTPVYTIYDYPNVESQINRYKSLGWDDIFFRFYTDIYNYIFDRKERIRLMKIEDFDEFTILGIYCSCTMFGVATKNLNNFEDFGQLFKIPENIHVEGGDKLIPQFTQEEIEKADIEPFMNFVKMIFDVTYSTKSDECQRYYSRF